VALELVERHKLLRWQARVHTELSHRIMPWTKHLRASIELARRAFETARETGDLTFAAYVSNAPITLSCAAGAPLAAAEREAEAALAFLHKIKFGLMIDVVSTQLQLIRSLRGKTTALGSFADGTFDEERFAQRLEDHPHLSTAWYWIHKVQVLFLAGDHAGAVAAAAKARPLLWTMPSFPETGEYVFYAALACAAHHDGAPEDERPRLRALLDAHHAQLAAWAEHCPDNFRARAALAGAELARLRGEDDEAVRGYEQAVRAARQYGFVQTEAIAYEAAARFHRGRGQALIADAYVREALARYARWGADGKVRQLRRAHPAIEPGPAGAAEGLALHPEQLGLLSVIKASQTISGVMDQELLWRTLLRFVLEEGRARRAVLAVARGGELEIVAEARSEGADGVVADTRVPRSLLSYVQRTQEAVRLDAEADAGRFAGDPYFAVDRPRSVLCLPVRLRAASAALLYLENDLVPGVFTSERLRALELLAAQAAISLENARLLERERALRLEAEAAERRELLLGEATALMSRTLDHRGLFDALARLCTGSFVDCALIALDEDGAMVPLGGAHRDPSKE
ncbi:MAG TPA: GAF domain-containing protein, partial [Bacteroidia bacterium]|nr:GAF domain-containing protein [Bacteroidia bacterium]